MGERGGPPVADLSLSRRDLGRDLPILLQPDTSRRDVFKLGWQGLKLYAATRVLTACGSSSSEPQKTPETVTAPYWPIRSVDTMKQSRDNAQTILQGLQQNPQQMHATINQEVRNIAALHTTHVAIGTPYDDQFLPVSQAYFKAARANGLNVWWRGNFSEFEIQDKNNPDIGWFNIPHNPNFMDQPGRIAQFIEQHGNLFQKGDIFTPWPEPENVIDFYSQKNAYQNLLLLDYEVCQPLRDRGINAGFFSMNGDVAKNLDPKIVPQIGNVVVIDHYVHTPQEMGDEISALFSRYRGAKVVVGEFGAPIPDLNGDMDPQQQAEFVGQLIDQMKKPGVIGMNYWDDIQGSTAIENTLTQFRPVYNTLQQNYAASARSKHK